MTTIMNLSKTAQGLMKLDFGCGQKKQPGYIGLDGFATPDVDVVHDFDQFPYPFEDNTFDEIVCNSSLEHVDDFMKTVVELHRIAKPGALIKVACPHYSGPDAYRDPTHKTFFSYFTFDVFDQGSSYLSPYHGLLKVKHRMFGVPRFTGIISYLTKQIFNRLPMTYERYLCWIFPAKTVYYELQVIKKG
ncbi:class I SAM-dependent methyltransferase [filamentous cyanobacterium LEGE 11480]|uniref:Class I SAM-dependent methyltransferase n=1 Tax=Romeriopsis navalis LEGE 11480 TaxID=2777977 RepID=A0A928VKX3_9CYAN|nr:class I SAM-dependent methyltransferase [Romeriopsis navalis]MBE9029532.1 class I SAM-dependent methyltransferase [Romeriopsis navalis LEGE 11480]